MSSEQLGAAQNVLKGNLGGAWDINKGYQDAYTDLGIARRFGGAAAAYSLRDVGAMNGRVIKVRRDVDGQGSDPEEDFSANQVSGGALENWVNGKLESTLPADVSTAAAAYSLRKVKASYGIPSTVVNGTENFPATVPSVGSPADIGNGFTVHRFSDGVADSESVTVSGGTITVTVIASGTGTFSGGCRIKGLSDNKQYTVSGEFRITSQGADGDGVALVDISDATAGTDEDSITTASTTFTPFFIDAGYNSGSSNNFVDLQANSNGSNSGTLTAEFRNLKIIENNNSAVRIRRTSDDKEVVVGFDSDNKVSASSPVTATPSGSTNATDLNGFLNESTENFSAIAYADINSDFKQFTSTPTISDTAISGSTGSVDALSARLGFKLPSQLTISDYSGLKIKVTGTVNSFTSDENLVISPSKVANGGTTFTPPEGGKVITSGTTGNFEFIFTGDTTNTFQSVVFKFGDNSSFDISNLKFEIIEHGATVHTWYDQAGSNNTVQETAANQPKIAENGALLADGLLFDGTDDFLNKTSAIFDGASSVFCVSKLGSTDGGHPISLANTSVGTKYLAIREFTAASRFRARNTTDQFIASDSGNNKKLTFGKTSSDTNLEVASSGRTADVGTNDYGDFFASSDLDQIILGKLRTVSSTGHFDGSIEEVIIYNSDQSDNRFKIESNINNYYGLYNDENEVTGAFTASGENSFTANGTDGFTIESATADAFAGIELNEKVPDNDVIYISFNADLSVSGTASPTVALRKTSISGTVSSDSPSSGEPAVTQGFNSFALVCSDADAKFVTFLEDANSVSYTISDFKVSRIARNGFVETWYDQSNNGLDMAQTTAADQPHIVENGGICKDPSGNNPTVKFVNVGTNLGSTFMTATPISGGQNPFTHLLVASSTNTGAASQTFVGCVDGVDLRLNSSLDMRIRSGNTNRTTSGNRLTSNTNSLLTYIRASGRVPKMALNNNALEVESATPDAGSDNLNEILGENSTSASNDNTGLVGTISESILYSGDKDADSELSDLKTDIDNHYNTF